MKKLLTLLAFLVSINGYSQFGQPYFNSVDWSWDMYVTGTGLPSIQAPKVWRAFDSSMNFHWYVKSMYFDTMRSNVSAMPTSVDRVMWQRMSDGRMMFSNASDWYNKVQVDNSLSLKFNITDTANKWLGVGYTPTWVSVSGKPSFATVATSGSYNDLSNKPTIPSAQVNSDWSASSGVSQILNKPTIPTNTNQLTNGSGFITSSSLTWSNITGKPTIKRTETYSGTTNASGLVTITFGTAFAVAPNIQANIINGADNQNIRITSITTTGATVLVRNRVDVIGLLPTWTNAASMNVDILITEK